MTRAAFATTLLAALAAPAALAQVYADPITISVGDAPHDVLVGSFSGGANPDIVVANRSDAAVEAGTIQLFTESMGSYTLAYTSGDFGPTDRPSALASGDFNGDGNLDLAVTLLGADQVAVLLGNGDGTFGAADRYDVDDSPVDIAVGDFNNDGLLDLITANRESDNMSLLPGMGGGLFAAAGAVSAFDSVLPVRPQPEGVAVADFDDDGNDDIAVTRSFSTAVGLGVRLGLGDLTNFADIVTFETGNDPRAVVTADMNGDGVLDILVTNNDSRDVTVLLGAAGTFTSLGEFDTGTAPEALAVGDMDGDGDVDVVTANREGDNISVLLNDGTGMLGAAANTSTGNAPVGVAVADLNGDGMLDIVTANQEGDSLTVLLFCSFVRPVITAQPMDRTVSVGDSVTLSVTATGDGATYQWRKNGQAIADGTSNTLVIEDAAVADTGNYDVVVSIGCATATSERASVVVSPINIPDPVGGLCPTAATLAMCLTFAGLLRFRPRRK